MDSKGGSSSSSGSGSAEIDDTPWEVHVEAAAAARRREEAERDAVFFSGRKADWTLLPSAAWERVIDFLDCRGGPSGAANLLFAFLGAAARRGPCDASGLLRGWLDVRRLRAGGNEALSVVLRGDGEVEIEFDRARELEALCEAVPLEELDLSSYYAAENLLARPAVRALHAGRLCRLECALRDLSPLPYFPRLEFLSLRQVKRVAPEPAAAVTAAWLAPLERLPRLSVLLLSDFKELPLRALRLPDLQWLHLMVPLLAREAQDAFAYSLPAAARIESLEVSGPAHGEDGELASAPYDTPLDLMAAAARCRSIRVQCGSLVLEDAGGEFADAPPHAYVVEALRRGAAWRRVTLALLQPRGGFDDAVHLRSGGSLEPLDLGALAAELRRELGAAVDVSGGEPDSGACFVTVRRAEAPDG